MKPKTITAILRERLAQQRSELNEARAEEYEITSGWFNGSRPGKLAVIRERIRSLKAQITQTSEQIREVER